MPHRNGWYGMNPWEIAHTDQTAAACRDARTVANRLGGHAGNAEVPGGPDALQRVVYRHLTCIAEGGGQQCPHLHHLQPMPRCAAGHYRGRETCVACSWQLEAPPADLSHCDQCGTVLALDSALVAIGRIRMLVITARFCYSCLPATREGDR